MRRRVRNTVEDCDEAAPPERIIPEDVDRAVGAWKRHAHPHFKNLLDAEPEPDASIITAEDIPAGAVGVAPRRSRGQAGVFVLASSNAGGGGAVDGGAGAAGATGDLV